MNQGGSPFTIEFQHTAARRRLGAGVRLRLLEHEVSTHSRPKAAGYRPCCDVQCYSRFNTQPPEGGWESPDTPNSPNTPFQHTAARRRLGQRIFRPRPSGSFQHTAARRRLDLPQLFFVYGGTFQHTAARRRLDNQLIIVNDKHQVSTHSRPKAAGGFLKDKEL